jgi:hypothetical protein
VVSWSAVYVQSLSYHSRFRNIHLHRCSKTIRGCIALAEHAHFAGRSRHIHLRWMFISDFIRDGILKLHQVPTTQQVADIGTEALPRALAFVLCPALHRLRPGLSLPTILLYSTSLNCTEHECKSRKYDCHYTWEWWC